MSLGHMLANNSFREKEIRKERDAAFDASSRKDQILEMGLGVGGAVAGGTAGAIHKERDNMRRAANALPVSDSVWSHRTGLGVGLGLLAGIGASRALEDEDNEERDAHRARIKELRDMDQQQLLKARTQSMRKQASELDTKDLDRYQKDEFMKAMREGQDSVTTEERMKRLGGGLAGTALGMVAGGKLRHHKDLNRHGMWNTKLKNLGSGEAVIGGIGGSFAGSAIGGAFANENAERDAHLQRMQDVAHMNHEQLLADRQQNMHKAASAFFALQDK